MNAANTDTGMRVEPPLLPQSASRESATRSFHVFCGTILVALLLTAGEILLTNTFSDIADLPRFRAVLYAFS